MRFQNESVVLQLSLFRQELLKCKGATIGLEDLPPHLIAQAESEFVLGQALAQQLTLHDLERQYIGNVLESTHGNKSARILGVDRTTLYRKLEEYKFKD